VEFLGKEFEVRSLPTDRFIGVDINRNRHLGTIHLSQPECVQKNSREIQHEQLQSSSGPSRSMCQAITTNEPTKRRRKERNDLLEMKWTSNRWLQHPAELLNSTVYI
jgi:hypothetical protein